MQERQVVIFNTQQPFHGLLLSILLSELVQRAVVPTKWGEQHLFGFFLHTAVEQRLCRKKTSLDESGDLFVCVIKTNPRQELKKRKKLCGLTLDEGIAYDNVLPSILRQEKFS